MASTNSKTSSTKLHFKVSARTARLIGRENVGSPLSAITEVIKNSYDADSSEVKVIFTDKTIVVSDSGEGMTKDVIANHWMTIGTDNKDTSPVSIGGRVKSGAKGIGRFALDKLGNSVSVMTKPSNSKTVYRWSMDWSMFDKKGASVNDIEANLDTVDQSVFEKKQSTIGISDTSKGTIIEISNLNDKWDKAELDSLFYALESLVPVIENDDFSITMRADKYPKEYGEVKPLMADDYDYRVKATYKQATRKIDLKINRNELDLDKLRNRYAGIFSRKHMDKLEFQLRSFEQGFVNKTLALSQLIGDHYNEKAVSQIGDFTFDFIFAKNSVTASDSKKYPYRSVDYAARGEWLKKFAGIRIYRDNFRVRPYGENGDDWLRLGERQAKSPQGAGQRLGAYRIRPNQIAGAILISRLDSEGLQDKSSREGIHEDESFRVLKEIVKAIINQFEVDRNVINFSISEEFKVIDKAEASKQEGEKALKDVVTGKKGGDGTHDENAKALAGYVSTLKDEKGELTEEIKILRSLASSGLVTAAAGHELWGYRNQLDSRADNLRYVLNRYLPEKETATVERAYDPYFHIANIKKMDGHIAGWLNYALRPIRKDRRSAKAVYLNEYLKSLDETWKKLLSAKKAKILLGENVKEVAIKMYPIDLDSIFNNLIVNSVDSFLRSKRSKTRVIKITSRTSGQYVIITYKDSGDGLEPEFRDDPSRIFMAHTTSKRNIKTNEPIGTGMGMYIVKTIIDECGGEISVSNYSDEEDGFEINMKFKAVKK